MDSFFGKSGTLQGLMNFVNDYKDGVSKGYQNIQSMRSDNALDRIEGLIKSIGSIVAMFI